MPIIISKANTPELLDSVYKIRHKVFSEEEGKFPAKIDGRVIDRFDAYHTSHNLVVVFEDKVIGSMRITLDSKMGLPADGSFNFRQHIPAGSNVFGVGMFCIQQEHRSAHLGLALMTMAYYFGISKGATHVVAPINPKIANLLKRGGFKQLGEEFIDPHLGIPVLPMLLDINDLNDYFISFVNKNDLHNFLQSYECYTFHKGEQIIKDGYKGDVAYVIVEGEVEIRKGISGVLLDTLIEGDVFGELALFTNDARSADAYAKTNVKTMVLHRDAFLKHIRDTPEEALKLITTLGQRIKNLNKKIV